MFDILKSKKKTKRSKKKSKSDTKHICKEDRRTSKRRQASIFKERDKSPADFHVSKSMGGKKSSRSKTKPLVSAEILKLTKENSRREKFPAERLTSNANRHNRFQIDLRDGKLFGNMSNETGVRTSNAMNDAIQKLESEFHRMKTAVRDTEHEIEALRDTLSEVTRKSENIKHQLDVATQLNNDLQMNAMEAERITKACFLLEQKIKDIREHKKQINNPDSFHKKERLLRLRNEELAKAENTSITLDIDIQELKAELATQDSKTKEYQYLQNAEFDKDVQLKLMRNEILDIHGAVRVFVGIKKEGYFGGIEHISDTKIAVPCSGDRITKKTYEFDRAFPIVSSWPDEIFADVLPFITASMDGYNVGVVAFGGKDSGSMLYNHGGSEKVGLYQICLNAIFEDCKTRRLWKYKITMSAIEVIGNVLLDVGHQPVNLVHIKDNGKNLLLNGLKEHTVDGVSAALQWIKELRIIRRDYNQRLLLSATENLPHFLMMVRIRGKNIIHGSIVHGLLIFCDIASSVNDKKCKDECTHKVDTVDALSEVVGAIGARSRKIPFRNSTVTHLLKPCLTGDAKCLFLLTGEDLTETKKLTDQALNLGAKIMKMKSKTKTLGEGKAVRIYHTT